MEAIVSQTYSDLSDAEAVARVLMAKGIPGHAIRIEDRAPAVGLNLGAGVPLDAAEAVIEQHDNVQHGYVVTVYPSGDVLNEAVANEVFSTRR